MEYFIGIIVILIIVILIVQIKNHKKSNNNQTSKNIIDNSFSYSESSNTIENSSENYKISDKKNIQQVEKIDVTFDLLENAENENGYFLFVDIETTGLPKNRNADPEDISNFPFIVQIAWLVFNKEQQMIEKHDFLIKQKFKIPQKAIEIHGITDDIVANKGFDPTYIYEKFQKSIKNSEIVIAHNIDFDIPIIQSDFIRNGLKKPFQRMKKICTMKSSIEFCAIRNFYNNGYKYPTLMELVKQCFYPYATSLSSPDIHDANVDVRLTAKCFFKLLDEKIIVIEKPQKITQKDFQTEQNFIEKINLTKEKLSQEKKEELFDIADDYIKEATKLVKTNPELAIDKIITAINLFPETVPDYFYKLAYYLQLVGLHKQCFSVIDMVINDLDKSEYSMYNMYLSIAYEKYCTYKYSEKNYKDYIFYYFKWLHHKSFAFACQNRMTELNEILKNKDKLIHLAPTKINGALKNLKLDNRKDLLNKKINEYFEIIKDKLITISRTTKAHERNFTLEEINGLRVATQKIIPQNTEFLECYEFLNNSFEDEYFNMQINPIINN
jgi:DNA polymerase-3 subunit epsilon